jgi:hypothetical protein
MDIISMMFAIFAGYGNNVRLVNIKYGYDKGAVKRVQPKAA